MIDGRASATALLVALSVRRAGDRSDGDAQALAAAALSGASAGWRALGALAASRVGRAVLDSVERLALPGLAAHHVARKRWIATRLVQVPTPRRWLWLGPGFDAAPRVLSRRLGATLAELEHPATLAARRAALGDDARVDCVPLALPADAARLVSACAVAPATLVAEGVAMYLAPADLLALLDAFAALPSPPRMLFSALAPATPDGRGFARERRTTRTWLAKRGEPFRWRLAPKPLRELLDARGWRVDATWSGDGYGEYVVDAVPRRA